MWGENERGEDDGRTGFRGAGERCGWRFARGLGGKQEGKKSRKYWGQSPIAPNTLPKSCRKLFLFHIVVAGVRKEKKIMSSVNWGGNHGSAKCSKKIISAE